MPNPALLADEDFREDCRMSTIPDYLLVLSRCADCGRLAKLSGGLCANCADPIDEEES